MDRVGPQVVALRKRNLSMYDIREVLEREGHKVSPAAIACWQPGEARSDVEQANIWETASQADG